MDGGAVAGQEQDVAVLVLDAADGDPLVRCDDLRQDPRWLRFAQGTMLATLAVTALIAHDRERQFQSALASRDAIGQAKGMIMERFTVDATRAFDLLKRLSQDSNTSLVDIAAGLVARGPEPKDMMLTAVVPLGTSAREGRRPH